MIESRHESCFILLTTNLSSRRAFCSMSWPFPPQANVRFVRWHVQVSPVWKTLWFVAFKSLYGRSVDCRQGTAARSIAVRACMNRPFQCTCRPFTRTKTQSHIVSRAASSAAKNLHRCWLISSGIATRTSLPLALVVLDVTPPLTPGGVGLSYP